MPQRAHRPLRVGVQVSNQHATLRHLIRDTVPVAPRTWASDIVFNWDHFFPLTGDPHGLHFEAWTMLGAWAEQTRPSSSAPWSTATATATPTCRPTWPARSTTSSGGDASSSAPAPGWFRRDYDEYGYEFGTAGIAARRARGGPAAHRGPLGAAQPAAPPRHPGHDRRRRRAEDAAHRREARRHLALVLRPRQMLEHKLGVLAGWCDEVGRDLAEIRDLDRVGDGARTEADHSTTWGRLLHHRRQRPASTTPPVVDWLAWRDAKNGV